MSFGGNEGISKQYRSLEAPGGYAAPKGLWPPMDHMEYRCKIVNGQKCNK